MKILITGAAGFTGTALAKHLCGRGAKNIFLASNHAQKSKQILACDFTDARQTARLISKIKPDQIFHCAGTFTNDYETDYRANVLTTKNILDAVLSAHLKTRVLLIGSAAEYGVTTPQNNPVSETQPLCPISNYGLTKVFQTELMKYYFRRHQSNVVLARTFNLYGQNISPTLAAGKIYHQIKKSSATKVQKIIIENLTVTRDYLSVADAVIQYGRIMRYGQAGAVYNVGSGRALSGRKLVTRIIRESGLPAANFKIRATGGPVAVKTIYANIRKLNSLPKHS